MIRRGEKGRDREGRRDHPASEREKVRRNEKQRGNSGKDKRVPPSCGRRAPLAKAGEEGGQPDGLSLRPLWGRSPGVARGRLRTLPFGVRGLFLYEIQLVLRRRREMLCNFLSPTNVFGHILTSWYHTSFPTDLSINNLCQSAGAAKTDTGVS